MTSVPVAPGVATARFTFRRRHLFWSVILGTSMSQPRALSFLDRGGRLLLEHPLKRAPGIHATYEEKTEKVKIFLCRLQDSGDVCMANPTPSVIDVDADRQAQHRPATNKTEE